MYVALVTFAIAYWTIYHISKLCSLGQDSL